MLMGGRESRFNGCGSEPRERVLSRVGDGGSLGENREGEEEKLGGRFLMGGGMIGAFLPPEMGGGGLAVDGMEASGIGGTENSEGVDRGGGSGTS